MEQLTIKDILCFQEEVESHFAHPEFQAIQKKLDEMQRYYRIKTMHYRTSVGFHATKRLPFLIWSCYDDIITVYPDFDFQKIGIMAYIHDDPEILTEDIPLLEKLHMNKEQKMQMDRETLNAIVRISNSCPEKVGPFFYRDLQLEIFSKQTLYAQLGSYFDKLDGFSEARHEVSVNNKAFEEPVENYRSRTFVSLGEKNFPLLKELFRTAKSPLLRVNDIVDLTPWYRENNGMFWQESNIHQKTGFSYYDEWRRVVAMIPEYGIPSLTHLQEDL